MGAKATRKERNARKARKANAPPPAPKRESAEPTPAKSPVLGLFGLGASFPTPTPKSPKTPRR
jgi:hypothetical protein